MRKLLVLSIVAVCAASFACAAEQGCGGCASSKTKADVKVEKNAKKTVVKKAAKPNKKDKKGCSDCYRQKTDKGVKLICTCKDPFYKEAKKMEDQAAKSEAAYKNKNK